MRSPVSGHSLPASVFNNYPVLTDMSKAGDIFWVSAQNSQLMNSSVFEEAPV